MITPEIPLLLIFAFVQLAVISAQNGAAWRKKALDELNAGINMKQNTKVAKNVIFFLGDGMGVTTVTASRIYKGQTEGQQGEETVLSFEKFSNIALSKTYTVDKQTADCAATATAFLCGVKANYGTIGIDETVMRYDCAAQKNGKVTSILKWSLDEGKSAGLVTTSRVTHSTAAAGYAHSADREWEGPNEIAEKNLTGQCDDIAVQLVENLDLQVIMGGGRRYFLLNNKTDPEYGYIERRQRGDGRDLIKEWKNAKVGKTAEYVWNKADFDAVNPTTTDYLLGLFESSHMQYEIERNKTAEPSLAEMTEKAIRILRRNEKGFFLFVEAGQINRAHHRNFAKKALHDVVALDEAVAKAVSLTSESDTLIVVSSDHSNVFAMGGYPVKGNDILGLAQSTTNDQATDRMPKTTLIYGDGPGYGRINLTGVDTTHKDYRFASAINSRRETHSGEDVAIYAHGPMAHLFYGVHEQNYIPYVMAYASCVGINKNHCTDRSSSGVAKHGVSNSGMIFLSLLAYLTILWQ